MSVRIRTRLTVWYVALLILVVASLGLFLVVRLQTALVRGVDEGLATRAAQISVGLQHGCEGEFQDVSGASLVGLPQGESGAQLLRPDGAIIESEGDPAAGTPFLGAADVARAAQGETVRTTTAASGDREGFRVLAVKVPSGACDAVIVVATSLEQVHRSIRELSLLLLIAGPIAIAVAALGGWWLAGRALAPVARMTQEAEVIGIEHLDERVEVPATQDELRDLASTLNAMLDRLQRGIDDRRRFAADTSHELRTPLAVMRAELEVSLRRKDLTPDARATLESAQEEVERMRAMVENLLTLARADEGALELLLADVDLHETAEAVATSAAVLGRSEGVHVAVKGSAVHVRADGPRIGQVLTNLLSNAIRFSSHGGTVVVETWSDPDGGGCSVIDDGPGVPPEMAGRIFDRFVRAEGARGGDGGTGLGLAICREIIEAHGGQIWVEARPGTGAAFAFRIPAAMSREDQLELG